MNHLNSPASDISTLHVPETLIGKWFLHSKVWTTRVLEIALQDLEPLIPNRKDEYSVVVDVGCGYGRSLPKLQKRFKPTRLIGMDIDPEMLEQSAKEVKKSGINAEFIQGSSSQLKLESNSVDLLFCHQTFHHLVYQEEAMQEFYRVLKPGGILLFAESTKRYIHSWIIRLFFRHPMSVQKTADEYLEMIKDTGFSVAEESTSYPFLWWSREDLGIGQNWFGIQPPSEREETLINLVAVKPEAEPHTP